MKEAGVRVLRLLSLTTKRAGAKESRQPMGVRQARKQLL